MTSWWHCALPTLTSGRCTSRLAAAARYLPPVSWDLTCQALRRRSVILVTSFFEEKEVRDLVLCTHASIRFLRGGCGTVSNLLIRSRRHISFFLDLEYSVSASP